MSNEQIIAELQKALSKIQEAYFSLDDHSFLNDEFTIKKSKLASKDAFNIVELLAQEISTNSN